MNNFDQTKVEDLNDLVEAGAKVSTVAYDTTITTISRFTSTAGVGTFNVDNLIYSPAAGGYAAATKVARIVSVTGSPGTTPTIYYQLVKGTNFANGNTIKEYTGSADGDASCTVNAVTASDMKAATVAAGWTQFYTETSGSLVEAVYTR